MLLRIFSWLSSILCWILLLLRWTCGENLWSFIATGHNSTRNTNLRCAGLTAVPLTPSDANHITVWQKRTRSAQSAIRRGDFPTANSECRIPRRAMSIDQVTSQLTSGIAKFVLGSFDRNIFQHQNRQSNEHKYFFFIFSSITEA